MMVVPARVIVQIAQNDLQIYMKFGEKVNHDTHLLFFSGTWIFVTNIFYYVKY
jgi:hypothetical protein